MPRTWRKKFATSSADAASATRSWPTTSQKSRCLSNGCGTKRQTRSNLRIDVVRRLLLAPPAHFLGPERCLWRRRGAHLAEIADILDPLQRIRPDFAGIACL